MSEADRKADTRRKIELGGLVIKAALADLAPETLLGALLEVRAALDANPAITAHWKATGLPVIMRKS